MPASFEVVVVLSVSTPSEDPVPQLVEDMGCDINSRDKDELTPLHWACRKGHLNIVQYLTNHSECDVEAESKHLIEPLHLACAVSGSVDIVRHVEDVVLCHIHS